ncbi:tRNA (N6-isopentenyl adenosine(37)-C2)-methylthiotransferase MiaB [Acidaminococcus intestini]|uniref:tRNA (N6-isopentenyl adenosine(37)-C2)-methylthiotransferase MiaB n=1 Tax=Acidaminococcus intestini TaxID=187327 RepID=UPI00033F7331|nr:tRNA (N6-isopentenyl adenosine(37)-C2)-methylthiotransferase MiaB [Acidaminococcus intestini]CDB97558.1 (Dimethylallyl)adenosine tRNA methylthiotransferase MiaB [Acidaminococcus intestini CAG:325]
MKKTYAIINYGCQMNESDSEHYAGQLLDLGYEASADYEHADVVVINTCCVRENAEKKILGKIGEMKRLKRENPDMVLCVAGCMAQEWGKDLPKKYPQVDLVLGTAHVNNFSSILQNHLAGHGRAESVYDDLTIMPQEFEGSFVRKSSFAAWVPIMYGCNNFCTYCIVPYVRGRERSRSAEAICHEIEKAVALGYKEFTLLGQNVNSYGKDRGEEEGFSKLLELVDAIPGVERIRYMTSHPRDMSEAVVRTIAESQHICKNFHIPVQSGSSRIMKAMNRGYDRERYLKLVETIRRCVPDAVITTDLIVGFPGETEKDFEETLDLLRTVEYDDAFTFIYSPRKGTPAAGFGAQVPDAVKHERLDRLMALQNEICLKRNKRLVGRTLAVMVEGPSKSNPAMLSGRTDGNDLVLWPKIRDHAPGDLVNVKMERAQTWLIRGKEEA